MASLICLSLWFSYVTILQLISTLARSDNYIIHMDISAMPKAFSSQHSWHLSTLSSALKNSKETTNDINLASSKLIYTYTHVINGFSANLSPEELETLKSTPGYISCMPDLLAKPHTTHSPKFLGLNPKVGAWPASDFGKDVIIGVLDTGVWPESESFKDDGMTKIPSRWKGQCENSIHFNSSLCNKKLIGAKFFNKGLLAIEPTLNKAVFSTRDTGGHGTHTSSIAAGSQVKGASYFGYASGTATGIAPKAKVAVYKVIFDVGAYTSDIIAGIDSAISDGVDILSISLGLDLPLYEDPISIATFAAIKKGIFVSTSAGNAGPLLGTVQNGAPWLTTVAAGVLDREFQGYLRLGNGVSITGLSLYVGDFSSHPVPIVFMGLCDKFKELSKVRNKIVVCEDKNGTLSHQVSNVSNANVSAAVFITNSFDRILFLQNRFPSMIVDPRYGEIVKAYTKRNSIDSKASMSLNNTVLGTKPAPSVDTYSSRGPSKSCPFVLKPDITAPGTSILAAWPPNVPVLSGSSKLFTDFNLVSGTSMACPHVAGVAALLKGAHPDWSPAAIRSAIMTTSESFDNTLGLIKDIGDDYKPASPLASGAGHVNPNRALDPGLVYDVGVQDYVNLLCALNITQKNITTITRSSSNDCSKPSLDLNYPSFTAFFNGNSSLADSRVVREFDRTVTNVAEGQTTYIAIVTPIKGFQISVIPNKLVFKEKNDKLSYKLKIEGTTTKKVAFGYLTWKNVKHVVKSPIVIINLKV
ncbi:hypothetical protein RJT34_15727 [Clitoria ternatea]|uniref:Uncharacterized protein n=1 Tax=Clitoria ternatea TaxID=43366 RepID=A0AAN9J5Z2_CLITE